MLFPLLILAALSNKNIREDDPTPEPTSKPGLPTGVYIAICVVVIIAGSIIIAFIIKYFWCNRFKRQNDGYTSPNYD